MNKTSALFRGLSLAFSLACASGLAVTPLLAKDANFPTSEDLRNLKAMSAPQLSPDGKFVLFTVTDSTAEGAKSHLWLVSTSGNASARQLTYSPASDKRGEHSGMWTPDSSAVLFAAKRGETTQIFRLPMSGGEAMPYDLKVVPPVDDSKEKDALPPVTESAKPAAAADPLPINPSGFSLSPDGNWLAIWAADPGTPGEKKAKEAKADALWVNHERHGSRLYLAALNTDGSIDGALKPVALAPDVVAASWSPKSDRLIAITELPNEASDLGPSATEWTVTIGALDKPTSISSLPATVRGGFVWSEDATEILFIAQTPEDAPPGVEELFALSLPDEGSGPKPHPVRLMPDFLGGVAGEPEFLSNGKVLVPVSVGTREGLVTITPDGKSAPESIPQKLPVLLGLNTNRKQTGWVWIAEGSDQPPALCFAKTPGGTCIPLAAPSLSKQTFRAMPSKLIQWQNEGLTIEGLLYLPPEAATKKVPLIVDVHGGPTGVWRDSYGDWDGFLLSHGWAILRPNPRGSSGYGAKFAAANKNDLGGADFRDIMAGVDFVIKNYSVDGNKLALMGYSYGGEMAGFAEGKTDRFKAIISGAPVIDQFSEYGTERGSWYDRWFYGKPWEHFEDVWRQSPLSGVGKAKTPFLLLQGESDVTDPVGQAQEMYRALRQAGVPVDLVTYPREDHGPLARGIFGYPVPEPWHGFDARRRIVQFLQKGFGEEAK